MMTGHHTTKGTRIDYKGFKEDQPWDG